MIDIGSPLAAIYSTSTMEHHHFNMAVIILMVLVNLIELLAVKGGKGYRAVKLMVMKKQRDWRLNKMMTNKDAQRLSTALNSIVLDVNEDGTTHGRRRQSVAFTRVPTAKTPMIKEQPTVDNFLREDINDFDRFDQETHHKPTRRVAKAPYKS